MFLSLFICSLIALIAIVAIYLHLPGRCTILTVWHCNAATIARVEAYVIEAVAAVPVDVIIDIANDTLAEIELIIESVTDGWYRYAHDLRDVPQPVPGTSRHPVCESILHWCKFVTMWYIGVMDQQKRQGSFLNRNVPRCICTDPCYPSSTTFLEPYCRK